MKQGPTAKQVLAMVDELKGLNPNPDATCAMTYYPKRKDLVCHVLVPVDHGDPLIGMITVDASGSALLQT